MKLFSSRESFLVIYDLLKASNQKNNTMDLKPDHGKHVIQPLQLCTKNNDVSGWFCLGALLPERLVRLSKSLALTPLDET
jgi:hypothetical protein